MQISRVGVGSPGFDLARGKCDPTREESCFFFRRSPATKNTTTTSVLCHKGSALRAAHAALYTRARKNTTKCKGGRKNRPKIRCNQRLIMPRATCAELIALCCAVCLLAMSHSDRQSGCKLQEKKRRGPRGSTINEERKTTSTRTYRYQVPGTSHDTWYCVQKKAHRNTAQHRTVGQGTAPHGTARHRTALLSYS